MNFTEEERAAYEDHLKWLLVEANTLKKFGDKAREEGREEGIKIGEVRGEARGEARSEARGEAKLIKMMIKNGTSIEEVSRITRLSIAKINELLKVQYNDELSD